MEALLSSCVPELHSKAFVFDVDCFRDEIDSDGRLDEVNGTCSLPVKLSKMKRLMIDVFPTD